MSWLQPVHRTPIFSWHLAHHARMVESDGWQVPAAYTDVEAEIRAARSVVGLADLSAFAKARWKGPGVARQVEALVPGSPACRPLGLSRFSAPDPMLACRLTDEHLLLLSEKGEPGASATGENPRGPAPVADAPGSPSYYVTVDATSDYAGFGLIGPRLSDLLKAVPLFDLHPDSLPVGSCAETNLAGVQALLIHPDAPDLHRIGIYVAWDVGLFVWETLIKVGQRFGLTPIGMEAWNRLSM